MERLGWGKGVTFELRDRTDVIRVRMPNAMRANTLHEIRRRAPLLIEMEEYMGTRIMEWTELTDANARFVEFYHGSCRE